MRSPCAQSPPPFRLWSLRPTGTTGTSGTEVITGGPGAEVIREVTTPPSSWRTSGTSPGQEARLSPTELVRQLEGQPRKMEMVPSGATMIMITT